MDVVTIIKTINTIQKHNMTRYGFTEREREEYGVIWVNAVLTKARNSVKTIPNFYNTTTSVPHTSSGAVQNKYLSNNMTKS